MPSFSYKFITFTRKLKRINMDERKLNRIKVVLAEKDKQVVGSVNKLVKQLYCI